MNEIKIKDINDVYDTLEMVENMGNEISLLLLDAIAIIYHSDILDKFNIEIIDKYDLKPEYHNLSNISHIDFTYYVDVLCNNYHISYHIEKSIK